MGVTLLVGDSDEVAVTEGETEGDGVAVKEDVPERLIDTVTVGVREPMMLTVGVLEADMLGVEVALKDT